MAGAGELWAMRLDPKRTLDELIASLAPDAATRERALSNRIYRELSSAVAGSQEFSAVAKLYELDRDGGFDAIVLDTPPSRNALDFLDAPGRLVRFFDGRALRLLLAQGGLATRVAGRAGSPLLGVLGRLIGGDVLREITAFVTAIGVDDRRARGARGRGLRRCCATRHDASCWSARRGARRSRRRSRSRPSSARAELPVAALVVNRVHARRRRGGAAATLEPLLGPTGWPRWCARASPSSDAGGRRQRSARAPARSVPGARTGRSSPSSPARSTTSPGCARVARYLGYRARRAASTSPSAAQ